jgi:hypothetical protein
MGKTALSVRGNVFWLGSMILRRHILNARTYSLTLKMRNVIQRHRTNGPIFAVTLGMTGNQLYQILFGRKIIVLSALDREFWLGLTMWQQLILNACTYSPTLLMHNAIWRRQVKGLIFVVT